MGGTTGVRRRLARQPAGWNWRWTPVGWKERRRVTACVALPYVHIMGAWPPARAAAIRLVSKEVPRSMTYIIAEPCVDVLDKGCVDVCPVDCIYEAEEHNMLLINPEECIDCAACEPVCPVMAIFAEDDTPEEWDNFIDLNYEYFGQSR